MLWVCEGGRWRGIGGVDGGRHFDLRGLDLFLGIEQSVNPLM
jgi:hypothetical protein